MASSCERSVVLSLLDGLTDKKIEQSIKALRISVHKNLENLLNTRRRFLSHKTEWINLNKSLLAFGLPDFMSCKYDIESLQNIICKKLTLAIKYYEPRLKDVTIKLLNHDQKVDRTLKLRIEGLLCVESISELVVFNSVVEPETLSIKITNIDQ